MLRWCWQYYQASPPTRRLLPYPQHGKYLSRHKAFRKMGLHQIPKLMPYLPPPPFPMRYQPMCFDRRQGGGLAVLFHPGRPEQRCLAWCCCSGSSDTAHELCSKGQGFWGSTSQISQMHNGKGQATRYRLLVHSVYGFNFPKCQSFPGTAARSDFV